MTARQALEAQYSPDLQVTSSNCPAQWLIVNGTDEIQPTSQAVALDDALVAQGCPQTLDIFPDTAHSFDYWTVELRRSSPPWRQPDGSPGGHSGERRPPQLAPAVRAGRRPPPAHGARPTGQLRADQVAQLSETGDGGAPGGNHPGHHPFAPLGVGPFPHRHLGDPGWRASTSSTWVGTPSRRR